jgi:hypothetical protein
MSVIVMFVMESEDVKVDGIPSGRRYRISRKREWGKFGLPSCYMVATAMGIFR